MTNVLFRIFLHRERRVEQMSLNIDMKIILPVKFSGVSFNLNSKVLTSLTELQRIESWENIPLEFHWLAVNSVQVSEFR